MDNMKKDRTGNSATKKSAFDHQELDMVISYDFSCVFPTLEEKLRDYENKTSKRDNQKSCEAPPNF
jgi:hypothetical protein